MLFDGSLKLVGEIAVGEAGEEGDAGVHDFARVEGLLPLADDGGRRGEEERGDVEIGYAEGAAWIDCEPIEESNAGLQ